MATTQDTETATAEGPPARSRSQRRWLLRLLYILVVLLVLAAVGLGGLAWYFSSQVLDATPDRPGYQYRALALHGNTIQIACTGDTSRPGTFALRWHGGHITVGAIVSSDAHTVTRRFTGNAHGLTHTTPLHWDAYVYSSPVAFHLAYQTVRVRAPLGVMPAWYIPGHSSTWVILVHGRGGTRSEGMRPLPTLVSLGLPVLDVTYRNDIGVPPSPDHNRHLGATEWEDVQAAARYALAHGARALILYGYSMGGSVAEAFLHRSSLAGRVRAAVLDAPALDWNATLDFRANQGNVPGIVTALAKQVVAWRLGLSGLDQIDGVRTAGDLKVPTLLIQGTADTSVPIAPNAALARARPDLITFVPVAGAEHTEAWNANPTLYTARLKAFLARLLK